MDAPSSEVASHEHSNGSNSGGGARPGPFRPGDNEEVRRREPSSGKVARGGA